MGGADKQQQQPGLGPVAVTHVRQAYLLLFEKSLNCTSDDPSEWEGSGEGEG